MGKITFRADDDLVDELEAFDASKSEVMRAALRTYLDGPRTDEDAPTASDSGAHAAAGVDPNRIEALVDERVEAVVRHRVDKLVRQRVDDALGRIDERHHPTPGERASARRGRTDVDARAHEGRSVAVDQPGTVHLTVSLDGVEVSADGSTADESPANGRPADGTTTDPASRPPDADAGSTPTKGDDAGRDGARRADPPTGGTDRAERREEPLPTGSCGQCGTVVAPDHVHCPNCGEKVTRRVFCECGDEVRSDWAFCPSCGRRTPAADVLDSR